MIGVVAFSNGYRRSKKENEEKLKFQNQKAQQQREDDKQKASFLNRFNPENTISQEQQQQNMLNLMLNLNDKQKQKQDSNNNNLNINNKDFLNDDAYSYNNNSDSKHNCTNEFSHIDSVNAKYFNQYNTIEKQKSYIWFNGQLMSKEEAAAKQYELNGKNHNNNKQQLKKKVSFGNENIISKRDFNEDINDNNKDYMNTEEHDDLHKEPNIIFESEQEINDVDIQTIQLLTQGIVEGVIVEMNEDQYEQYLIEMWRKNLVTEQQNHIWWQGMFMTIEYLYKIYEYAQHVEEFYDYLDDIREYEFEFYKQTYQIGSNPQMEQILSQKGSFQQQQLKKQKFSQINDIMQQSDQYTSEFKNKHKQKQLQQQQNSSNSTNNNNSNKQSSFKKMEKSNTNSFQLRSQEINEMSEISQEIKLPYAGEYKFVKYKQDQEKIISRSLDLIPEDLDDLDDNNKKQQQQKQSNNNKSSPQKRQLNRKASQQNVQTSNKNNDNNNNSVSNKKKQCVVF